MSKRLTFLIITQSQLARIDVAGGKSPRAKGVWIHDRFPGESIATLADAAIRLGPKGTGDVWVFANEFWTGVIHVAGDVAAALDAEELDQAIALEAETYSGVSAFESRLGLKSLPKDESGEARWWVTQIPQREWQEVDKVVQQFRGKLAGMGHAALATFPVNLGDHDTVERLPWRLNQAFGEATVSINGVGDTISDVITFGDLSTPRTQSQLQEWCEDTAGTRQALGWVTDGPLPDMILDSSGPQLVLATDTATDDVQIKVENAEDTHDRISGETAFRVWAETMATSIQAGNNNRDRIPVAFSHKPPMSNQTATLIACALGLLLAVGCFALHAATNRQLASLDSQIDAFNRKKKTLTTDKAAQQALEKELAAKRQELVEIRIGNQELSANLSQAARIRKLQQTRWLKLVSALAKASEGGCWVRGLESRGNVVTVQGIAVTNQDISVFATKLEKYASPHGWRVHPAQTESNEMALVDFEVSLDVSDSAALDPQFGSSVARSSATVSLVAAPTQAVQAEIRP